MNRHWPIHLILAFCCLYLPFESISGHMSAVFPSTAPEAEAEASATSSPASLIENLSYSTAMSELMSASRSKYAEGSALIKTGDLEQAQEAFNKAVDLLMQSNWDLASTPVLNRFFQDLIQRIQQDESRYLYAPYEFVEEEEEVADVITDKLGDLDLIPFTLDPDLRAALAADLAKTQYEIPITINEMVLQSLSFWLNRGRKVFEDGLVRSGQYRPMIEKVFREESIPLDLMYLAQVESMFRPHAVSKAKAKGIWQFEKGTAIRYGLKVTRDVDERSDPEKSTRAAAHYLNDLFAMFKDWNLALAAYNWGEGKVQRLINSTGMNDFWQLTDLKRKVPAETKNHVPLIQASVILGRNPEKYGLPTELDPPMQYTEVSVSKPIDLRAAARVLSTSIEELKKLNPALRGLNTPANYPNFQLKVPLDSPPEIEEQLASLPTARITALPESDCRHKVHSGETLTQIAARYKTTVAKLEQANGFSAKSTLKAGAWIHMPSCSDGSSKAVSSKKSASAKKALNAASAKSKTKNAKTAKKKTGGSKAVSSASAKKKSGKSDSPTIARQEKAQRKPALEKIAAK
jgi:membrane-bound lytic murein transglycosylase D